MKATANRASGTKNPYVFACHVIAIDGIADRRDKIANKSSASLVSSDGPAIHPPRFSSNALTYVF
jgi:hypothetical protein